jgi:predicted TIM-barrel fold metal-dependent hydrolase
VNDSPALAGIGPDAVIDTESHLCLRAWPSEAYPDAPRYEHYHWHEHGADLFVSEMDRAGVDRAFVISYDGYDFAPFMRRLGFTPSDFYGGVPYTRGWIDRYPDRLVWFTTLQDPRDPDNLRLLAEQLSDGAAGCKFFPAYLDLEFSDPAMTGVYDLLESLDRRLMVGLEDSPEPSLRLRDAARALASRLGLPVQFNHGGSVRFDSSEDLEAVAELTRQTERVFISTSVLGGPWMEWDDGTEYPFRTWLSRVQRLVDAVGVERVVWGTDWPWFEHFGKYPQFLDAVRLHADFLDADARRAFLGGNARRYLGLA